MNSIRVNGLSKDRTLEELKVYFSKPKNGGGRINKIYYPLLNNDAVIVYEDEDVATQVLSVHDHDVYGDAVDVLPLPISVFTEVQASLDPGVASMIKTTYQCEDRLRYICEVEIVTDDNHNVCLRGDVYQIEMAWKVISHFLQLQRQIHSSMLNSAEKLKMEDRHNIENGTSATSSSRARRRQRQEESRQSSVQGRGANGGSHVHDTRSDSFRQNGQTYGAMDFTEEERYDSHKYSPASREEDKPKIIPRRSLQNDASRPLTQPGAETSEYRQSEIDRIIKQTQEDRANRSKNSSLRSNDSMSKIGPSQVESIDIPPVSSHNHFTGQREALHEHDYLSLGSRYGESLSHAFPQNHADSSGDESLQARGTGRLSDANDTFEKFSSLKVSSSPGQSDKSTSKSKRSNSMKEKESEKKSSSPKVLSYSGMESMNSVLKDTEKILRESNLAAESAINRYTFNVGHIKVRIYHGNITAVETAGLVNAANGSLANGAGVAGAIARAASPTMQQECDAYIKKFGILGTGEVMHTRAGGRLSARVSHIIHAVGPIWLEGLPDRCAYELTLTYLNVLKYAEKLWLPSITLPCISSGIFGSPLDVSIKCFLDGLLLFVSESKKDYHLLEVNMVNNDEDGVITTIAILHSLLEAGQDLIMAQAIDRFTKLQEKRKPSTKVFSSSLSSKTGTKDDFHSLDYGKPSPLMSTDPGKRRSSSLSRATGKTKMKDPESPRGANLEGGKSKGSGLSVSGKNPGSTLDRSASERSGSVSERRSRLDSAGSSRPTTASRLSTASGAKNSPRAPPTMKQSLVTSPPGGGAKPKTKTNTSSRNVPMKASTLIPSETRNQMLSPRTEAAISKTSQRDYNVYENDVGLHSLPADLRTGESDSRFLFCKICINEVRNPKTLYKCGHTFCTDCIDRHLRKTSKCPTCGVQYDKPGSASEGSLSARETLIKSTQPLGTMSSITRRNLTVPGFEYCEGAIEIHYDIPSGKQGKYDPLPGQSYTGVQHKAYLPNSAEGREILRLLKHAFKANKVFRISGRGTIEWNISHKTKISSFSTDKSSYPDPLHLRRVREELSRKGIV